MTSRPRHRGSMLLAAAVGGVVVGLLAASTGTAEPEGFWFVVLLVAWTVGTVLVLWQPRPSLAFVALQVWMALNVLNGAVLAMVDGRTGLGNYDFSAGLVGGMRMAALAQIGLVAGMLGMRAVHPARPMVRVDDTVPARELDRWAVGFLAAGAACLLAYVTLSGAGLGSINVLTGGNVYGDLKRAADGVVISYLKVFTGLIGVGLVLATLRLTHVRRARPLVPLGVIGTGAVLLVASGGRSWLLVPVVASGLSWFKTTRSGWSRRPRRLLLAGGLAVFAIAALVGGLRGQAGDKVIDPEGFVAKELRGGIFPTTAGLADSVPARQPYLAGRSLLEAGTLAVPRALWPDKPTSALKDVQDEFMPKDIGASFGFQGELYANAGPIGVLVGSALFAALLEWCWLRLTEAKHLWSLVWFAALVPVLIHVFSRGYLVTFLAGQLGTLTGVAVASWLLRRRAMPMGVTDSGAVTGRSVEPTAVP